MCQIAKQKNKRNPKKGPTCWRAAGNGIINEWTAGRMGIHQRYQVHTAKGSEKGHQLENCVPYQQQKWELPISPGLMSIIIILPPTHDKCTLPSWETRVQCGKSPVSNKGLAPNEVSVEEDKVLTRPELWIARLIHEHTCLWHWKEANVLNVEGCQLNRPRDGRDRRMYTRSTQERDDDRSTDGMRRKALKEDRKDTYSAFENDVLDSIAQRDFSSVCATTDRTCPGIDDLGIDILQELWRFFLVDCDIILRLSTMIVIIHGVIWIWLGASAS